MLPLNAKPVEVTVDGVDVSSFVDSKFLGLLSKKVAGVRAASLTFIHEVNDKDIHGEPKLRTIRIMFVERPKKDGSNPVSVDTQTSEDLQATLSAIEDFMTPANR
jgi:hypothetical protein